MYVSKHVTAVSHGDLLFRDTDGSNFVLYGHGDILVNHPSLKMLNNPMSVSPLLAQITSCSLLHMWPALISGTAPLPAWLV